MPSSNSSTRSASPAKPTPISLARSVSIPKPPPSPTKPSTSLQPRKSLLVRSSPSQDPSPLPEPNAFTSPIRLHTSSSISLTKRTSSPLSLPPVQFSPLPPSPKPESRTSSPPPIPSASTLLHLSVLPAHLFSRQYHQKMTLNSKNYAPKSAFSKQDGLTTPNDSASSKAVYPKQKNGSPSVRKFKTSSNLSRPN